MLLLSSRQAESGLRCHTMVASFEVMALCLEGITNWVVCLYVQIGRTVAVAHPIIPAEGLRCPSLMPSTPPAVPAPPVTSPTARTATASERGNRLWSCYGS